MYLVWMNVMPMWPYGVIHIELRTLVVYSIQEDGQHTRGAVLTNLILSFHYPWIYLTYPWCLSYWHSHIMTQAFSTHISQLLNWNTYSTLIATCSTLRSFCHNRRNTFIKADIPNSPVVFTPWRTRWRGHKHQRCGGEFSALKVYCVKTNTLLLFMQGN